MSFGEKSDINNEINKAVITENNFDKQVKYSKPEFQEFYNNIIKDYPQINEKNLQNILGKLDIGKDLLMKGFDVIKNLIHNDNNLLFTEKSEKEVEQIILIIKDEINNKYNNKDVEKNNKDVEKNNKDVEKNNKDIENKKKAINQSKENLNKLYVDIPEKFKDKNKINKFREENKTYLTNISNKINKFGISEEDYVKNRYTALQLSQDNKAPISNKYEFIKSFNQLNKLLDIDIQIPLIQDEKPNFKPLPDSLDDFQTKPDKILALDSVQDYIKISPDTLTDIDIKQEDIIKLYSDKIPDTIAAILSKNNLDQSLIQYFDISNFNSNTLFLDKSKISQITDKNLLDQLQQISETITDKFTTDGKKEILLITNKTIKEKVMSSVFRGISDFFDITNDNIENFANDFKLDFDQDLKFKNNVVNIKGQINGSYVGLSYDLINGKLSIDDLVSFNSKDKLYKIGKQSGSVLNIPITLPTLKDFKDDSLKFDYKTLVSGSDNIDQYKNDLNKQLGSVFYGNFVHRELNQYYIRQSNEKNLAVQSGLSYMFDNFQSTTGSDYTFDFYGAQELSFTEALNSDHFRLIKMVDDSFDYYNQSSNFLKIRNLFEQFNMLINTRSVSQGQSSEKLINILFNSNEMKNSSNAWQSMGNNGNFNYLRFYDLISKSSGGKKIIDIDILDKLVGVIEKGESLSDPNNRKKFTSSFRNKYESIINDPDKNLENKLKEI